jgi:hypothetical protein
VLGALAESDERDIGPFPRGNCPDVLDIDLPRNHFVAKGDDDWAVSPCFGLVLASAA